MKMTTVDSCACVSWVTQLVVRFLAPAGIVVAATMALPSQVRAQESIGPVVDVEWLARRMGDARVLIIQAEMRRKPYDDGHVPGARFLDMTRLVWDGDPAWGTEMQPSEVIGGALRSLGLHDGVEHVVLYATNPLFASRAFMTMEVMGLQGRVHVLDGGLAAWISSGREVTTEEPPVSGGGTLTLGVRDDVLVSADWIYERLGDDAIDLVDARPDDEYTGEDGGLGNGTSPGHIPGAYQMYWEELVESREAPYMRDRSELVAMFEDAGVTAGDTVVAYCMVGWRASYTYLAARLLGYDAKLYDGSWRDWGGRNDLPSVTGREPGELR